VKIDANELRRHYQTLSDDEMLAIDPAELTEVARKVYEEEYTRRGLDEEPEHESEHFELPEPGARAIDDTDDDDIEIDSDLPPEWSEDASVVASFLSRPGDATNAAEATRARKILRAAGIDCRVTLLPGEEGPDGQVNHYYSVMVPGALNLHATAILDRDLFNPKLEEDWHSHFECLSDKDLRSLNPDIFCAGLLDRVARLKRAYTEEMSRRGL